MGWTGIALKTAPAVEPVTAAQMREYLRLSDTSQDTLLDSLITAARCAVEGATGRTLITTSHYIYFDEFEDALELARPPVQSVTAVKYYDDSNVQQTLASTEYEVDAATLFGRMYPAYEKTWPGTASRKNAVEVDVKCGYGDNPTDVPEALRVAVKMLAADLFEHPEAHAEVSLNENRSYKYLLSKYLVVNLV
jgi:uncharacterized phiE125 gp8 family phage protein